MINQSKYIHEIEEFKTLFADKKNKKIALYGTGRMTATLLSAELDYDIVGLLDRDMSIVGNEMYGVKIIDIEEAEEKADIIVINTVETYWQTIYNRIKKCKLPIYYRNGQIAIDKKNDYENNSYWNTSMEELLKRIDESEIISFDIFGTLIGRRIYSEIDALRMLEKQVGFEQEGKKFVEFRKRASTMLRNPTINEIYDEIQKISGWKNEVIEKYKRAEIELDKRLIYARNDMVELCKSIMLIKEVYLVSDMYYTKEILKKILENVGLDVPLNRIIVSGDLKKSKEDGELWDFYDKQIIKNRKALHIGDNKRSDIHNAESYGISAYYVMNPQDMLKNSVLAPIESYIVTEYDSVMIGMILSKVFNNPFALNEGKGKVIFSNAEEMGFCLWGSVVFTFILYLYNKLKNEKVENVFFLGRDGYLLVEIYNYFLELSKLKAPKGRYLEISRRAVMNAAAEKFEDICTIAEFPYDGTINDFFKDRFNVILENERIGNEKYSSLQLDKDTFRLILKKYENKIIKQIKKEKKAYLNYLKQMKVEGHIIVVDLWFHGSIQFYLGKLLKKSLHGFYFCIMKENNKFLKTQTMKSCFQKKDDNLAKEVFLYKNVNFVESFFTAPKGMLKYIDENGHPIYQDKKMNQKNFDIRYKMLDGIKEYVKYFVTLDSIHYFEYEENNAFFVDRLFGEWMNGSFIPSVEMKNSFYYDNGLMGDLEVPIWE